MPSNLYLETSLTVNLDRIPIVEVSEHFRGKVARAINLHLKKYGMSPISKVHLERLDLTPNPYLVLTLKELDIVINDTIDLKLTLYSPSLKHYDNFKEYKKKGSMLTHMAKATIIEVIKYNREFIVEKLMDSGHV